MKIVKRSELSTIRMVAGNEKKYQRVIQNGIVKNWVGFGWVNEGEATNMDYKIFCRNVIIYFENIRERR